MEQTRARVEPDTESWFRAAPRPASPSMRLQQPGVVEQVVVDGAVCARLHWSQSGALPPGLSFSGGVITGTPTAEGRFLVTITVTDTEATPQSAAVSFIIDPVIRIT